MMKKIFEFGIVLVCTLSFYFIFDYGFSLEVKLALFLVCVGLVSLAFLINAKYSSDKNLSSIAISNPPKHSTAFSTLFFLFFCLLIVLFVFNGAYTFLLLPLLLPVFVVIVIGILLGNILGKKTSNDLPRWLSVVGLLIVVAIPLYFYFLTK